MYQILRMTDGYSMSFFTSLSRLNKCFFYSIFVDERNVTYHFMIRHSILTLKILILNNAMAKYILKQIHVGSRSKLIK